MKRVYCNSLTDFKMTLTIHEDNKNPNHDFAPITVKLWLVRWEAVPNNWESALSQSQRLQKF